jgi:hypothetical protein
MTSFTESSVQPWDEPNSVDARAQRVAGILAAQVGIAMVALLTWVVLLVVR